MAAVGVLVGSAVSNDPVDPVVGSWYVHAPDAPFAFHMFSFHGDGTMSQANPDAGNAITSDSDGLGVWYRNGGTVAGKFTEVTADRGSRAFVARGEISFTLTVTGDRLAGSAVAHFYGADGSHIRGPLATAISGTRVVP